MNTWQHNVINVANLKIYCTTIFSAHAHFKLEDGRRLGRVTCSPSETDENFNGVSTNKTIKYIHYNMEIPSIAFDYTNSQTLNS